MCHRFEMNPVNLPPAEEAFTGTTARGASGQLTCAYGTVPWMSTCLGGHFAAGGWSSLGLPNNRTDSKIWTPITRTGVFGVFFPVGGGKGFFL